MFQEKQKADYQWQSLTIFPPFRDAQISIQAGLANNINNRNIHNQSNTSAMEAKTHNMKSKKFFAHQFYII